EFVALPLYLRGFVDPNAKVDLLLSVDPATVILFQILVSYLTRKVPAFTAMTLGADRQCFMAHHFHARHNSFRDRRTVRAGTRRDHAISPLLRIHFAPRA